MSNLRVSDADLEQIIRSGNVEKLVNTADSFGRALAKNRLTKSQIRNVFGEVRKIEARWGRPEANPDENLRRLLLLKPRMAYQSVREPTAKPLLDVLSNAIDLVIHGNSERDQHSRFRNFTEFFEAILAYHTAEEDQLKRRRRN